MRDVETGTVSSPLHVEQDLTLAGVAEAGGSVRGGATLRLSGVMHGELRVESGGHVEMSGVFNGVLFNAGRVIVSGVFEGEVARNDGEVLAHVGSVWQRGGRRLVLAADGSLVEPPRTSSYSITTDTPLCRYADGSFEPMF